MFLTPSLALLASLALHAPAGAAGTLAMQSPWWENYDQKDRFLCSNKAMLVLERNASQASLISGRSQVILFREDSDLPMTRYRNAEMQVTLRGDELTVERLPLKLVCQRTEQV